MWAKAEAKVEKSDLQRIAADLDLIKKLMVLGLVQKGFQQKQIASLFRVSEATLSEMFPKGLLKQARVGTSGE